MRKKASSVTDYMHEPSMDEYDEKRPLRDTMSPEEYARHERSLRWKIDIQIVPLCTLLYFLSFLDRTNIAQAKITGLMPSKDYPPPGKPDHSLNLRPETNDYEIALTVLYPPYILLEIPANLMLKYVGASLWLPFLITAWGIVSTLQGIVSSRTGLYINRAFLGAAEAGILPGIAVYLTFFYKPRELQLRQAIFFTGASLSGAFSGLLAAAIGKMEDMAGLGGWQWIFILEGIFTVLVGVVCFFLLPDNADKCFWLTPIERQIAQERLQHPDMRYKLRPALQEAVEKTDAGMQDEVAAPVPARSTAVRDAIRTFIDPVVWTLCFAGFCTGINLYSIAYFSPTIVQQINNYSSVRAKLMSCPPYAVSFVYSVIIAFVSDYFQLRFITALPGMLLTLIGFVVIYACTEGMERYGGLIILSAGVFSLPPVLFAWLANNSSGHYKRATGLGLLMVFTNCGGLASTWLFGSTEGPKYVRGLATNVALAALGTLLVFVIEAFIWIERKKRDTGKRDHLVTDLKQKYHWSGDQIREYLGDDHPEYYLEM
ncbi:hypothetical protein MVES1_000357 [Malassezia vespertilionis]|uniref:Major facilitator superfamily (MFS) profile domain-containing protein n=1 Tax=Malassezia vespertilionis TaxID=2020962 RepID=A0A2N1JFZ7_9BASI|nr:uncharacterized protein MVES1_000357 [Malassezia vespertilionis]PKI85459.1 hypothetical protein MVES_000337 [Malassezia vespertilionis]WFD05032.1 hypothetical protein MVES1_000357 [Malassezia vespertilionis]